MREREKKNSINTRQGKGDGEKAKDIFKTNHLKEMRRGHKRDKGLKDS